MAKKKGVDLMVALLGSKPKKGGDEEGDAGSPKEEAAQRLIDGVKAGSAKKVALAFEELQAICSEDDYESDDEEMDDDAEGDEDSDYA